MSTPSYARVNVGDSLPSLDLPPIDRTRLALFGGASGDHNPIHIDIDFARRSGMPDVFAHGMLGIRMRATIATAAAVVSTNPTASRPIEPKLRRNSRGDVNMAAAQMIGGRKTKNTRSGSRSGRFSGVSPSSSPATS